jgi:hypothetical protein
MPAPHGKKARPKTFLLRMTEAEDAHVRDRARLQGVSINDAITRLIDQDMPPEQPRAAPEPPGPAPGPPAPEPPATEQPRKPKQRRQLHDRRRGSANLSWSDVTPPPEEIPGQTSVLDDDQ